jgi:hypothetical protein
MSDRLIWQSLTPAARSGKQVNAHFESRCTRTSRLSITEYGAYPELSSFQCWRTISIRDNLPLNDRNHRFSRR